MITLVITVIVSLFMLGIELGFHQFSDLRELRIDRPFIFYIRDRIKGSILFAGKVEDPGPRK